MVANSLHDLCLMNSHSEKHNNHILKHIALHPEEASEECDEGSLPLHYLLRNQPPLHVVEALVDAYPEAVFCSETINHYLPLHVACRHGCDPDVVDFLIQLNPDALNRKTQNAFFCSLEQLLLLCLLHSLLKGSTCTELVEKLPKDHPNREALLELLDKYDDVSTAPMC
jgi:ankyrin repeat protein